MNRREAIFSLSSIVAALAGDYGSGAALYLDGPLQSKNEEKLMGSPQFLTSPRERYLTRLKALEAWAQSQNKASFHSLNADQIDISLTKMEKGEINFGSDINSQALF